MADKLILNTNFIRKADRFVPKKCAVEKVIEVFDAEFKTFLENPMRRNHYLTEHSDLMGYYDDTYHGVLFINKQSGDGLLVNSEGYDYARYAQYVPNARDIVQVHEHTVELGNFKKYMDRCLDRLIKQYKNDNDFRITLEDIFSDMDLADFLIDYTSEYISNHPQVSDCSFEIGAITATKHEFVETKLYCPLKFTMDSMDDEFPYEISPTTYARCTREINEAIRQSLRRDERERIYGLNAYMRNEHLAKKLYSIFPGVEICDGDLYGIFTIKSYGELDKTELTDVIREMIGQASDGWGESFEQHPVTLDGDEIYISFWNSDDDYFLKPESEAFPEQEESQTMGGIT